MSSWSIQDFISGDTVTQKFRITRSVNVQEIRLRCVYVSPLFEGASFTFTLFDGQLQLATKTITATEINNLISGNQLIDIVIPYDGVFLGSTGNEQEYELRMSASNYFYDDNPSGFNYGYIAILNRTIQDNTFSPRYGTVITSDPSVPGTPFSTAESANFTPLWMEIIGEEL